LRGGEDAEATQAEVTPTQIPDVVGHDGLGASGDREFNQMVISLIG